MKMFNPWFQQSAIAVVGALTIAAVPSISTPAIAGDFYYQQTNLVSDDTVVVPAGIKDPNLKNPWGISSSPTGPFWVSNNGTGTTTLYNGLGVINPLVVTIPPPPGSSSGTLSKPTGQVFNGSSNFMITDNNKSGPSRFIFATEDGTISGWNPSVNSTNAIIGVDKSSSGAVYKGLGINSNQDTLFAANFSAGTLDKFDQDFTPKGSFIDGTIPAGFAPFNVQNLGGKIYVTYAKRNPITGDDIAAPGNGYVDIFDPNTNTFTQLLSQGQLNSPWGLAIAPADFGTFSNALLVGNFGDGKINAFDPSNGNFLGQLKDANGKAIAIDGLWGLAFGNGGNAGKKTELFFTAGINGEENGLFGKLEAQSVPEPSIISLFSLGLIPAFGFLCRRKN